MENRVNATSETDVALWCYKGRSQKEEMVLCGKSSQAADPPTPTVWERHVFNNNKKLGLFVILGPKEHFWCSPKNRHFG